MVEQPIDQNKERRKISTILKKYDQKTGKRSFITVRITTGHFHWLFLLLYSMWIADEEDVQTTIQQQGTTVTLTFQTKSGQSVSVTDGMKNQ